MRSVVRKFSIFVLWGSTVLLLSAGAVALYASWRSKSVADYWSVPTSDGESIGFYLSSGQLMLYTGSPAQYDSKAIYPGKFVHREARPMFFSPDQVVDMWHHGPAFTNTSDRTDQWAPVDAMQPVSQSNDLWAMTIQDIRRPRTFGGPVVTVSHTYYIRLNRVGMILVMPFLFTLSGTLLRHYRRMGAKTLRGFEVGRKQEDRNRGKQEYKGDGKSKGDGAEKARARKRGREPI